MGQHLLGISTTEGEPATVLCTVPPNRRHQGRETPEDWAMAAAGACLESYLVGGSGVLYA